MGGGKVFDTPKPTKLIERVIEHATDKNSLILDSFAGSGTTAHAVLNVNKGDNGNRRFILIEMEKYADRLTAGRVRRVIRGYKFSGTQRFELLRERILWKNIKDSKLIEQVRRIEKEFGEEYKNGKISKEILNNELVVFGEKKVQKTTKGLGGEFTYCKLGSAIQLDKILAGKSLPNWNSLGSILFHMATSCVFDAKGASEKEQYLGCTDMYDGKVHVWLIYRPDLEWLKSHHAALTLDRAREIFNTAQSDRHIIFAPARYVSRKVLDENKLRVEFAPLPFALYRMEKI